MIPGFKLNKVAQRRFIMRLLRNQSASADGKVLLVIRILNFAKSLEIRLVLQK